MGIVNGTSFILRYVVEIVEVICMCISVWIIVYSVCRGIYKYWHNKDSMKHIICKGLSNALNFNLVAETLKIVIGQEERELFIIGGIIVIKILITFLFMLEMKQDDMRDAQIEKLREERRLLTLQKGQDKKDKETKRNKKNIKNK